MARAKCSTPRPRPARKIRVARTKGEQAHPALTPAPPSHHLRDLRLGSSTDSLAFKNPDGTLVAVVYAKSAKSNYIVKIGGQLLQFAMPADGWASVVYE